MMLLIVESNGAARGAASEVLRRKGFHVDEASTAMEALGRVRLCPPEAILMEPVLALPDHFLFLRALQSDPWLARLPLLPLHAAYRFCGEVRELADEAWEARSLCHVGEGAGSVQ
jgi:CheY-like chemotaxis protein